MKKQLTVLLLMIGMIMVAQERQSLSVDLNTGGGELLNSIDDGSLVTTFGAFGHIKNIQIKGTFITDDSINKRRSISLQGGYRWYNNKLYSNILLLGPSSNINSNTTTYIKHHITMLNLFRITNKNSLCVSFNNVGKLVYGTIGVTYKLI